MLFHSKSLNLYLIIQFIVMKFQISKLMILSLHYSKIYNYFSCNTHSTRYLAKNIGTFDTGSVSEVSMRPPLVARTKQDESSFSNETPLYYEDEI